MASSLPILLTLSSLSTLSAAYTWKFASPPQQCSNLTVSLWGSGGVPPFRLLVLPNGPTPLSSGVEVRKIVDVPFPDGARSVSFKLRYPAFSQLVAVVSIFLCLLLFFSSLLFFFYFSFIFCSHFCYVFFGFVAHSSMFGTPPRSLSLSLFLSCILMESSTGFTSSFMDSTFYSPQLPLVSTMKDGFYVIFAPWLHTPFYDIHLFGLTPLIHSYLHHHFYPSLRLFLIACSRFTPFLTPP